MKVRFGACAECGRMIEHDCDSDANARDAARYRWLRDRADFAGNKSPGVAAWWQDNMPPLLDGKELDDGIDAAMRGHGDRTSLGDEK
jgi:hypothetical protein